MRGSLAVVLSSTKTASPPSPLGIGESAGICLPQAPIPDLAVWTKSPANPLIPQTSLGIHEDGHGLVYGAADPSRRSGSTKGATICSPGTCLSCGHTGSSATLMSTRATLPISSSQTIWSAGTTWAPFHVLPGVDSRR